MYNTDRLPKIKEGILLTTDNLKNSKINETVCSKLNLLYAKDYKIMNDIILISKAFHKLCR
jgi:hypothetical protein